MRLRLLVATLSGALIVGVSAAARAQSATSGSPIALVIGAGSAFAVSQPGFDRDNGSAFVAGLEFTQPWRAGVSGRLGLRLEGGFASQSLSSSPTISGNVQTIHAAALINVAVTRHARFNTYLLAGPVWSRPSTRIVLTTATNQVPGAGFEQTTHETAPGVLLGAGAGWRVRSATVRVEARWISLATNGKATSMVPVVAFVALPLHR